MNLGPDNPNTGDFDIDLRPGTRVGVYSLTVVGWNGTDQLAVFYLKARVFKRSDNTFSGVVINTQEGPLPSWASVPVIDSTVRGGRISFNPKEAVWRTSVRVDLISDLDT